MPVQRIGGKECPTQWSGLEIQLAKGRTIAEANLDKTVDSSIDLPVRGHRPSHTGLRPVGDGALCIGYTQYLSHNDVQPLYLSELCLERWG